MTKKKSSYKKENKSKQQHKLTKSMSFSSISCQCEFINMNFSTIFPSYLYIFKHLPRPYNLEHNKGNKK